MTTLAVVASGLVTGLGFNAPATLAALRAGLSAVRETPWKDHGSGDPIKGSRVSLPHWWEGTGKLADLVAPAIHECLQVASVDDIASIPVLVGVSAPDRPGRPGDLDTTLLDEIAARLGSPLHPASRLFAADQAGCAQALVQARALLARPEVPWVVVAGVDSLLAQDTLEARSASRRLVTGDNSNGFFPGEAGTAVLLADAERHDGPALVLLGLGFATEPATIEGTAPLRAEGLTRAMRQALEAAGVTLKDVAWRLADLSGEHYKFKEAAFAAGRLNDLDRDTPLDIWHPIESLGEIGAAVLPCLFAMALDAGRHGRAPGRLSLCHVGSDAGERAAVVAGMRLSLEEMPT
ncbi:MAG: hypothetical protein ABW067_12125 [Rhizobacter sp.]